MVLKGSLRLAPIGLEGAVIDASYTFQDSETTDPFTGETREMRFKPHNQYTVKFRHDIAAWKLNYTIDARFFGERFQSDINFRDRSRTLVPTINTNVQYRLTNSLLLWFDVRFPVDNRNRRVRDRFIGNIADGNILRTEVRNQFRRREFILGLRGQF